MLKGIHTTIIYAFCQFVYQILLCVAAHRLEHLINIMIFIPRASTVYIIHNFTSVQHLALYYRVKPHNDVENGQK